jgi:hypothetical protein
VASELNLVPNPVPLLDLFGWRVGTGGSAAVDPLWPPGGASVRVVNEDPEAWAVRVLLDGGQDGFRVSASDGIYAAVRVKAMQRCRAQAYLEAYSDEGAHTGDLGRDSTADLPLEALGEVTLMVSCGIPPGTTHVVLVVEMHPDWEATDGLDVGSTLLVSQAVLMRNAVPFADWFAPDSPEVTWTGPPHRSPSARLAPEAERLGGRGSAAPAAGFTAFTPDSPWNRTVRSWPVHPDSDRMISFVRANSREEGALRLEGLPNYARTEWGMPIYVAGPDARHYRVTTREYLLPPEFTDLAIPDGARATEPSADGELVVYDFDRGTVAFLWQARHDPRTRTWTARGGSIGYLDGNGLRSDVAGGDRRNPVASHHGKNGHMMAWRWDEVLSGRIKRAVRVGLSSTATALTWTWPLTTHSDGQSDHPDAVPTGSRLRLRSAVGLDHLGTVEKILARALQTHGLVVADCTGAGGATEVKLEDTLLSRGVRRWPLHHRSLPFPITDFEFILDPRAPTT